MGSSFSMGCDGRMKDEPVICPGCGQAVLDDYDQEIGWCKECR